MGHSQVNTVYYLASNANGYFDDLKDAVIFPTDNQALPLDGTLFVQPNDMIKAIYPYYDLEIGSNEQLIYDTFYKYDITWEFDQRSETYEIPFEPISDHCVNSLSGIAYVNEDVLLNERRIALSLDCESGIYVSEYTLECLGVDKNPDNNAVDIDSEHLVLHTKIMVPLATEVGPQSIPILNEDTGLDEDYTYEARSVTQYKIIDYSFEIEGVLARDHFLIHHVYYPYALSKEIYENTDKTVTLSDSQSLWEPNTYIIECQGDVRMEDLGNHLLENIDTFILADDEMGKEDHERRLFSRDGDGYAGNQ